MKVAGRRLYAPLASAAAFWAGSAAPAVAQGMFEHAPDTDIARAWLDLLFRGTKLPDAITVSAPNLSLIAEAVHQALGIYSNSVLVIAALLLFYNLAVMVVETAHTGVPMGKRSNQVWAPIRLVLAIGFLVPVSSGLNSGQYVVSWMAEQGSSLGSHVWRTASETMRDSFSGIAMPESPNVSGFVVGGLEMEFCRALYRQNFKTFSIDKAVVASGDIDAIQKIPRTRFAEETWQYTDRFQSSVPMCGAYRFASTRVSNDNTTVLSNIDRLTNELADFSRGETDKLVGEMQPLAEKNLPIFLGQSAGPGVHDDVMALLASHQAEVDEKLHDVIINDPQIINQTMAASADSGWVTAGSFMLQLSRLQEMYGTLASRALPAVQAPIFASASNVMPALADQIAADPVLWAFAPEDISPLKTFQTQMTHSSQLVHDWLYNRQLIDVPMVLANPFDLRSQMAAGDDPEAISSLYGHVLNDAANSYGVWNPAPVAGKGPGTLVVSDYQSLLAIPNSMQNPLTALAEFGRRQVSLGNYLFGVAGPDVAPAGTLAHSILLSAVGLGFMASGFALMFLIPLLPFFRFFMGVITWLLAVFEAILAIPIVALAHVNVAGEGLSGGTARQAYLLWLNILVRPVLTLFGFITGLLLFSFAIVFLGMVFYQLSRLAAPANGELFVTLNVAITFLYTILACAAANMTFKGITLLPELAFKWLGGIGIAERSEPAPNTAQINPNGAQGIPNLAVSSSLLAQQNATANSTSLVTRGYAVTAARANSLKMALFPNYRDNYTPPSTRDGLNNPSGTPNTNVNVTTSVTSTMTNSPHTTVLNAGGHYLQKPERSGDKPRRENMPHVGKRTDMREGGD